MRKRPELYDLDRRLCELGWRSKAAWARAHRFRANTVTEVILRYWDTADAGDRVRGEDTIQILDALKTTVDRGITPEDMKGKYNGTYT